MDPRGGGQTNLLVMTLNHDASRFFSSPLFVNSTKIEGVCWRNDRSSLIKLLELAFAASSSSLPTTILIFQEWDV
jgi:hypothetical protein